VAGGLREQSIKWSPLLHVIYDDQKLSRRSLSLSLSLSLSSISIWKKTPPALNEPSSRSRDREIAVVECSAYMGATLNSPRVRILRDCSCRHSNGRVGKLCVNIRMAHSLHRHKRAQTKCERTALAVPHG